MKKYRLLGSVLFFCCSVRAEPERLEPIRRQTFVDFEKIGKIGHGIQRKILFLLTKHKKASTIGAVAGFIIVRHLAKMHRLEKKLTETEIKNRIAEAQLKQKDETIDTLKSAQTFNTTLSALASSVATLAAKD